MANRFLLNANQAAEARIQNAAIDRVAAAMAPAFGRALSKQMNAAADAIGTGGSVAGAVLLNSGPLNAAFLRTYKTAAPLVGRRIIDQAKSLHGSYHIINKADGVPVLQLWNAQIARFIAAFGALRVQNVNETTIALIQRVISASYNDGAAIIEVQRRIRDAIPAFSAVRSRAIARTETHAGAMGGSLSAAQVIEIDTRKRWNATEDGRTRPDHADADGQIRDLDASFVVGGDKMQHPGDPRAGAANVVNCRCVLDYPID
jgi:hypothetical protein